jgi:hypothetical protein
MSTKYASNKRAHAFCDRCGFRYKLRELKEIIQKTKKTNLLVCPTCWESDHPQLKVGMYPVSDPQSLLRPRPDNTLGADGSRDIQWGWKPVGLNNPLGLTGLSSDLEGVGQVGIVSVTTS